MELFEGQSLLNFIKELPNDEACKAYLGSTEKLRDPFIFHFRKRHSS